MENYINSEVQGVEDEADDWDNIPVVSAGDFFGKVKDEDGEEKPLESQPDKADEIKPDVPSPATPSDDDFWGEGESANKPSSLRGLLSKRLGLQVTEEDDDEAVLKAITARLRSAVAKEESPIEKAKQLSTLDDADLVRQRLISRLGTKVSKYDTAEEIEAKIADWEESGELSREAAYERRLLQEELAQVEGEATAKEQQAKADLERSKESFRTALNEYELDGIKIPSKEIPSVIDYLESGKYILNTQGTKEDGTMMSGKEMVEQALFANPVYRAKFIERAKKIAADKAVSDYIKKLENRATPVEAGGFPGTPSGERTVGFEEFFGRK